MTAPTISEQATTAGRATEKLDPRALTDSAADLLNAMAAMPAGHPSRPALRDRAIEAWLPLARHLAHRYSGRGEPTDDLVQTAAVGLIKAVDKFDPDRGVDFAGYAIPTIIGEIKRHFRDRTWDVRVPRRLQELRLAITEANSTLTHTPRPLPDGRRHRRPPRASPRKRSWRAWKAPAPTTPPRLSTPISDDGSHRARRHPRRRGPRVRARRDRASPSAPRWPPSTSANRRSSPCASTAT